MIHYIFIQFVQKIYTSVMKFVIWGSCRTTHMEVLGQIGLVLLFLCLFFRIVAFEG
jgi:hypothetical protein